MMPVVQRPYKAWLVFIVSFVFLAFAALAFSFTRQSVSAAPAGALSGITIQPLHPASNSKVVSDSLESKSVTTCDQWSVASSPNAGSNSSLRGIAAVSANDVWAVGSYSSGSVYRTLIEHWNGLEWSVVSSPNAGTTSNSLDAVAVVGTNDVWAVGSWSNSSSAQPLTENMTLVERWDGSEWNIVSSPSLGTDSNSLQAIAVVSPNDVWAVGDYYDSSFSVFRTLVERWNGSEWNIVPSPNSLSNSYLQGIAVVAPDDVWAVGNSAGQTLTLHWDGTQWNIVPSPSLGTDNKLQAVAVAAPDDVWAVGNYWPSSGQSQTLVERWNGSEWNIVPSPSPGFHGYLYGVAVTRPSDVWAAGSYEDVDGSLFFQPLVERWNGSQWNIVPSPNQGTNNFIYGVAIAQASDVWTVGYHCDSIALTCPPQTLTGRYIFCPPTPTPTPQPPPCPSERFTDVCPPDYFYPYVQALADDGILSGYDTAPPCNNSLWIPCFKPYNNVTRGQISKIVSLAAGFNEPVSSQTFIDVPPGSTFYTYTERMAERDIVRGYLCGSPGEPCVPPLNPPYFRPNNNVTRGQLAKMVSRAFGWYDLVTGQNFEDVPSGSAFYTYTAQLHNRSIASGYPCGSPGEPCIPPQNRPYFRSNNNVIRGQTAKIVQLSRQQPTPTVTATSTPTSTSPPTDTPTQAPTYTPSATRPTFSPYRPHPQAMSIQTVTATVAATLTTR